MMILAQTQIKMQIFISHNCILQHREYIKLYNITVRFMRILNA